MTKAQLVEAIIQKQNVPTFYDFVEAFQWWVSLVWFRRWIVLDPERYCFQSSEIRRKFVRDLRTQAKL